MDVQADVSVCSHGGLAGVQPHPHPHRPVGERQLSILGCGDRVGRTGERNKEGIHGAEFEKGRARGRTLSREQAIEFALSSSLTRL